MSPLILGELVYPSVKKKKKNKTNTHTNKSTLKHLLILFHSLLKRRKKPYKRSEPFHLFLT